MANVFGVISGNYFYIMDTDISSRKKDYVKRISQ